MLVGAGMLGFGVLATQNIREEYDEEDDYGDDANNFVEQDHINNLAKKRGFKHSECDSIAMRVNSEPVYPPSRYAERMRHQSN
jgi:hypothetical protein